MHTHLDSESQEKRTVCALFPLVESIAFSEPQDAYQTIKQNNKYNNTSLSEIFDAFWWCLYGMLYSTEDERMNAQPHDDYFYDENAFKRDTEIITRCEMMRNESKTHRYPIPRRGNNPSSKKKIKQYKEYCDFVHTTTMFFLNKNSCNMPETMYSSQVYKVNVDMIRCSQEQLIGKDPNLIQELRKSQYIDIGNLLDDVFIHRGYVNKISDEGAEMLTPEQVDEWEMCKKRIKEHQNNHIIPGFIRNMIKHKDFILELIE